jgi:hypothetical protein
MDGSREAVARALELESNAWRASNGRIGVGVTERGQ